MLTETPLALTRDDIKALRTADDVNARRTVDGSQIEAVRRTSSNGVFSQGDERRIIATRDRFSAHDGTPRDATAYAFMIGTAYDPHWETVVSLLRPGDELELHWIAGNSNGYLREAGLHRDHCNLTIYRRGERKYSFRLSESVSPNNTARMIRG